MLCSFLCDANVCAIRLVCASEFHRSLSDLQLVTGTELCQVWSHSQDETQRPEGEEPEPRECLSFTGVAAVSVVPRATCHTCPFRPCLGPRSVELSQDLLCDEVADACRV